MKTAAIFIGLLVVVAMPVDSNKFMNDVVGAITKCGTKQKAAKETVNALMSMKVPHDEKVSCLLECTLTDLGVMENGNIDATTVVSDIVKSHKFDSNSQEVLKGLVDQCKKVAEGTKGKCGVAGKFGDCVKEALHIDG